MIVGFTGTRSGMTATQKEAVAGLLREAGDVKSVGDVMFVHGDCLGADAEAHDIALAAGIRVHIRPCTYPNMRAHCVGAIATSPTMNALARNRMIVDQCQLLIATPWSAEEQARGGTWYTIRYARDVRRQTVIVAPDGSLQFENIGTRLEEVK